MKTLKDFEKYYKIEKLQSTEADFFEFNKHLEDIKEEDLMKDENWDLVTSDQIEGDTEYNVVERDSGMIVYSNTSLKTLVSEVKGYLAAGLL